MRAFEVKKGTKCSVIKDGAEWTSNHFKPFTTTKDLLFFVEEIAIDPAGIVGCGPQHKNVIGGAWAAGGYYGFRRDGYCLMVPLNSVTVH